jgi:hypothetical protein
VKHRSRARAASIVAGGSTLLVVLAGARALTGCIIADTASDLPKLPSFRPTIVHASLVPPENQVLRSFPDKFIVPVELVDPNVTFERHSFIDYDVRSGLGIVEVDNAISPDPGNTDAGIRTLEVSLPPPSDLTRCHTIEILVALSFFGDIEGQQAHTPKPPGGDGATWFYAPNGDVQNCPTFTPDLDGGDASGSEVP